MQYTHNVSPMLESNTYSLNKALSSEYDSCDGQSSDDSLLVQHPMLRKV
jgi:hypothetical protein